MPEKQKAGQSERLPGFLLSLAGHSRFPEKRPPAYHA